MNKEFVSGAGVQEYSPCSIKWFWKALRHYADFSGRARRREYWSFVFFNLIFSFSLIFLSAIFFIIAMNTSKVHGTVLCEAILGLYSLAMLLPSLAVSVRRLHDIRKSGAWAFVIFIPVAGAIYLFILLCTEGDDFENQYGDNPKTSREKLSDATKFKIIAVTMITGYSLLIIKHIIPLASLTLYSGIYLVACIAMIIAGVLLYEEKSREDVDVRLKAAIYIIIAVMLVSFITHAVQVYEFSDRMSKDYLVKIFTELILYSCIIVFTYSIVFMQDRTESIIMFARITIAALIIHLIANLCTLLSQADLIVAQQLQLLVQQSWVISDISLYLLAAMFLPLWKSTVRRV